MKFLRWSSPFAALALMVILWANLRYHTSEFKGGVNMRDSGSWIAPRYRAELRPVSLNNSGAQEYELSGLPSSTFSLNLLMDSPDDQARRAVARLHARLSVDLTDDGGNKLCSADGIIAGAEDMWNSTWILARSASWAYLWSPQCLDMPISRRKGYRLTISVADVDPNSPKVDLIPILRGGGNELP